VAIRVYLGGDPALTGKPKSALIADWNPRTNFVLIATDGVVHLEHFNFPLRLYSQTGYVYATCDVPGSVVARCEKPDIRVCSA
jgi:hypothetical protein